MAKATEETLPNNDHAGATQSHLEGLAAKSAENIKAGGKNVEVSLVDTHVVKFKKDFGFIKKDAVLTVSQMAFDIYNAKGVIEKQ